MASVLSLADAKDYLGISDESGDVKLQGIINSAEATLTKRVGGLQATARTDRVRGGLELVLPVAPVISLTSVTEVGGNALSLTDLWVEPRSGVIAWLYGGSFAATQFIFNWYDVVYQAGRSVCPDDLREAIIELVIHMWESQRGPMNVLARSTEAPSSPYLLPYRVQELIAPYIQPGFA